MRERPLTVGRNGNERVSNADGTVTRTFTIVTAHASAMLAELHDRAPVIIEPQDWSAWLERVEGEPATLLR